METAWPWLMAAALFALGLALGWLLARGRLSRLETTLELERRSAEEKLGLLKTAEEMLRDSFKALSAAALERNNESFLHLAKSTLETVQAEAKGDLALRKQEVEKLVTPIKEQLDKLHQHNLELERARHSAYGTLSEQVKALGLSQEKLESSTSDLVSVLRQPHQRGKWGEVQLDNVLRAAGMLAGLDFVKQPSVATDDGRLRPDVIVYLPDGGQIVVDAKAPVEAFLNAHKAATPQESNALLKDHIRLVKTHITALSGKEYWSQFSRSPEWVVMFVPMESFLTTALANEPDLIAESVRQRVILASPITLIALLTAVASGWRQKRMEERVEEIGKAGAELYDRLAKFAESLAGVGESLRGAVGAYNKAIGSLQARLLPSARRIKELDAPTKDALEEPQPIEAEVREIQAEELRLPAKAGEGEG